MTREGRHRFGRQGKRPTVSPAYVVASIEIFGRYPDTLCWRFRLKAQ